MKTPVSGTVVAVRGSVVDVRFDETLPPIYTVLRTGVDKQIVIEVLSQRDAHHVRGIALTPTQGLARGMAVDDTGGPLQAPVGKGILSRMFDVFGNTIDGGAALSDVDWRSVHRAPPRAGETFDEVGNLRNGHQGDRRARAARTRRQGGIVRRRGRG